MPGLEGAIEPRAERRERTDGGPQGPERRSVEGVAGGKREAQAHTLPIETSDGERFAVVPARTPDGERIASDRAIEMVRAGELEPIGIFSTMEEAERAKAQMRGDSDRRGGPAGGGGMAEALGLGGDQAAGMGGLEAALAGAAEEPADKKAAKRQMEGRRRGRD